MHYTSIDKAELHYTLYTIIYCRTKLSAVSKYLVEVFIILRTPVHVTETH